MGTQFDEGFEGLRRPKERQSNGRKRERSPSIQPRRKKLRCSPRSGRSAIMTSCQASLGFSKRRKLLR